MRTTTSHAPLRHRPLMFLVLAALGMTACSSWVLSSCYPDVPSDDAGDLSWARQVVPILYGRKVKGSAEARVIAGMVAITDRPTVLRALMQDPQFNEHWSETLVNALQVDREGAQSQLDCYGGPLRPAPDPALAQHVLAADPATPAPGGAFNMSDLVRSAVALDDLAPIFRAHLFAQQHRPAFMAEQQTRDELGLRFEETFLNRQSTCLACHNSDSSLSGAQSGWPRWYPILGSFEQALYGASTGADPVDIHAMFRTDQNFGPGAIAPWGISGCGSFSPSMPSSNGGNPYFTGPLAPGATVTALASLFKSGYDALASHGLNRTIPASLQTACTACQTSCSGGTPLDPEAVPGGTFVRDLLTDHGAATSCGTCHGATQGLWFYPAPPGDHWYTQLINTPSNEVAGGVRVVPGDSAHSELIGKLNGTVGSTMPLGGTPLSAADLKKVSDWIDALPSSATCSSCPSLDCDPSHVEGTEAFAYLTAASLVNKVWQEVMGYPETIANYFPRNAEQRGTLWSLTEYSFLPTRWSLRALLVTILSESTFNRRPPATETGPDGPYREPRLFDPWEVPDPRVPPASDPGWDAGAHPDLYGNAMTDGIYRYSAWNLLRSTQEALDWPAPQRFPTPASYPAAPLERSIGQYFSTGSPGFRSTNFGTLLAWEKELGTCSNHQTGPDWVERLAAAAGSFTPAGSDPPLTLGDVLTVERDWLLGDGTIATVAPAGLAQSEQDALASVVGPLGTQVSALSPVDLRAKVRSVCGILLETPQYFLAGVAPEGAGPSPRLRVCNAPPCTFQEMCGDLASRMTLPTGVVLQCGTDSVGVRPVQGVVVGLRQEAFPRFCPECPMVPIDPRGCFERQEVSCQVKPPACDPRCTRSDCCGGPVPPVAGIGTIILWADGAAVTAAEGVRTRTAKGEVKPLARGTKLAYGDLLEVPAQSELSVSHEGKVRSYKGQPDLVKGLPPRYLLVSGPPALQALQRKAPRPTLSATQLEWLRTQGWRRLPDGATQTVIAPVARGPGQAEREWAQRLEALRQK